MDMKDCEHASSTKDREHASSTKDREHARRIQTQQSSADVIVKEEVTVHHIRMILTQKVLRQL